MTRQRGESRARWVPVLVPVLLAWACTPVPPAAAPTQKPANQEAATREPASSQVETMVSHTSEPDERADDPALPSSPAPETPTPEPSSADSVADDSAAVDFATDVQPILEAGCRPCHFEGGKMYGKLPFDRPETIRSLGEERLFTRIKDEEERGVIRAFLEQMPESPGAAESSEPPW